MYLSKAVLVLKIMKASDANYVRKSSNAVAVRNRLQRPLIIPHAFSELESVRVCTCLVSQTNLAWSYLIPSPLHPPRLNSPLIHYSRKLLSRQLFLLNDQASLQNFGDGRARVKAQLWTRRLQMETQHFSSENRENTNSRGYGENEKTIKYILKQLHL